MTPTTSMVWTLAMSIDIKNTALPSFPSPNSSHGAHPGGHLHRVPRFHLLHPLRPEDSAPEAPEESGTVW